jgi:hypothetical protein
LDAIQSLLSVGFGCFGVAPGVITLLALFDAIRMRADWYWFIVILAFPLVGSIAYFVVMRSPLLGTRNAAMMSPAAARRLQARRRLRELEVQLSHWRGPAVLAEAGEETLVLGKPKEAEKLLRESQENGGAVEDVNFPLAQALEMQGRWDEAVPLLEALCKFEPDARLGQGLLHLARSLDESGRKDEAEAALRKVLDRRTVIEAQVRLARILFFKGEKEEAGRLVSEVLTDAKTLPRYLQREHRSWIRAARRLKSGTDRLPAPRFEGQPRAGHRWRMAAAVAGGLLLLAMVGGYAWMSRSFLDLGQSTVELAEERKELLRELDLLDQQHPWAVDDLAKADLQPARLDRYLKVRQALRPAVKEVASQDQRYQAAMRKSRGSARFGDLIGVSRVTDRWMQAQTEYLRSFVAELKRQGMGPRELEGITNIIEWRFLRRPEALVFGVPEFHRQDWTASRVMLRDEAAYMQASDDPETQRWRQRTEAKLADYERQAGAALEISPATRTLLESRRADLERLSPDEAPYLIHGLDPTMAWTEWE